MEVALSLVAKESRTGTVSACDRSAVEGLAPRELHCGRPGIAENPVAKVLHCLRLDTLGLTRVFLLSIRLIILICDI